MMYPGMTSVLNAMVGPALFAGRVKLVEQVRTCTGVLRLYALYHTRL